MAGAALPPNLSLCGNSPEAVHPIRPMQNETSVEIHKGLDPSRPMTKWHFLESATSSLNIGHPIRAFCPLAFAQANTPVLRKVTILSRIHHRQARDDVSLFTGFLYTALPYPAGKSKRLPLFPTMSLCSCCYITQHKYLLGYYRLYAQYISIFH